MSSALLSVAKLDCHRGNRFLLSNMDFSLQPGDLLQIVGANGSGKTSLLRLLAGLYPLQTGSIHWCGKDIRKDRYAYQQQIYYLSHSLSIKNELTIEEYLQFNWRSSIFSVNEIDACLSRLALLPYKHELCRHLSRGQRQRVAIAQLLLAHAKLWILDEPFASLDQIAVSLLQQLFVEQLQQDGAIIFTSHQPLTLATLTPKVISI